MLIGALPNATNSRGIFMRFFSPLLLKQPTRSSRATFRGLRGYYRMCRHRRCHCSSSSSINRTFSSSSSRRRMPMAYLIRYRKRTMRPCKRKCSMGPLCPQMARDRKCDNERSGDESCQRDRTELSAAAGRDLDYFVVGFPDDMQEREFQNMFTFSAGLEAATLKIPNNEFTSYGAPRAPAGPNTHPSGLGLPPGPLMSGAAGAGPSEALTSMNALSGGGSHGEAPALRDRELGALGAMCVGLGGLGQRRERVMDGRDDEDRDRRRVDVTAITFSALGTRGPRERAEEDGRERRRKEKEKEAARLRQNSFAFEAFHSVPQQMIRQGANSLLTAENGPTLSSPPTLQIMASQTEGLTGPWGNLRDVSASAALRKIAAPIHVSMGLPPRPPSVSALPTSPPQFDAINLPSAPLSASSQNGSRSAPFSPQSNASSLPSHPSLPSRPTAYSPSSDPQPLQSALNQDSPPPTQIGELSALVTKHVRKGGFRLAYVMVCFFIWYYGGLMSILDECMTAQPQATHHKHRVGAALQGPAAGHRPRRRRPQKPTWPVRPPSLMHPLPSSHQPRRQVVPTRRDDQLRGRHRVIRGVLPVFAAMEAAGLVLNLHGKVPFAPMANMCVLNTEPTFLPHLRMLHAAFPCLRIVLEHATTRVAVECVKSLSNTVACTITAHHLALTVGDWMGQAWNFCKPVRCSRFGINVFWRSGAFGFGSRPD
ncbi:Dihydroorotase [Grifola frondosa]|uniref:Dihydroorotase n=1 Tax=Grifola frondosa TaxID=5627 RepID=A0A1C7M226_GRIFR|nr:Dihydroorotase [Grifola frondosa]